jgi:flagellar M-ring protein FliF
MNDQVQGILKQLSITQRIGIIGAAVVSVAMIAVLVMFASKTTYTPAFTNLSAADATTIEGALRGANIAYQVADAGTTIEVPVEALGNARIAAGTAGYTSGSGGDTPGWNLFDNQGFGQSQFDQSVTYQRAIEGELTKTIQAMTGVASARVAIVLAQTGALSSQDTPASASVVLAMTGHQTPGSGLVQAIVNTVSRSVQGLSTDNVVVTDDQGHVLAGAANSADTAAAQAKDLVEQQVKSKIDDLLVAALGAGHASIAVSADVDSSKVEQQITTYAPSGSNPPVSVHNIVETYGANGTNGACGIPGTNSNVPGLSSYPGVCAAADTSAAPAATPTPSASASPSATPTASTSAAPTAAASDNGAGGYLHEETTINYSVSQTVQHIVTAPGVVKRISVAVLVDKSAMGSLNTDTLQASISAAIGADKTRGDVVAVNAVPFAAAASQAPVASPSATGDMISTVGGMSGTIIGILLALVMLVLFWVNSSALKRRADESVLDLGPGSMAPALAPVPNRAGIPATTGAGAATAAIEAAAAADAPNLTPQARIQERLRIVADERPDALVGLMHGWLREEDRRRS